MTAELAHAGLFAQVVIGVLIAMGASLLIGNASSVD